MERRGRVREVRGGAEAARVPPHDLDAERAVIGAMLVSEAAVAAVAERLQPEDFYSEVHRIIYGAMTRLYARGDPIDQLTLTNELRSVGEFEKIGGRAYVFQIVESVPTAANAARYAEIVRGKALLRDIIDVGSRITEDAFREPEDVGDALDAAEQLIYGVSNRTLREHLAPVSELAPGALEMIQRLYEQEGEVTGVESGFEDLDRLSTGFHKSDLIILAARPAMGKCLSADAEIVLDDGSVATIEQVFKTRKGRLMTLDENLRLAWTRPGAYVDDGIKPVFRVTTRLGRTIKTTIKHPFLTMGGWRKLGELSVGDHIAVPRRIQVFGCESLGVHQIKLLAYMLGDGCMTNGAPRFTNATTAIRRDFIEAASLFGGLSVGEDCTVPDNATFVRLREILAGEGLELDVAGLERARKNAPDGLTRWLKDLGLWGLRARDKFVPPVVFQAPREELSLFLNRLFVADGWATVFSTGRAELGYATISEKLARQVQHLLLRFGVVAALRKRAVDYGQTRRPAFHLNITDAESIRSFIDHIGIFGEEETVNAVAKAIRSRRPHVNRDLIARDAWTLVDQARDGRSRRSVSRHMGFGAGHNLGTRALSRELADGDVYWDQIVRIEALGEEQVYDLTIPGTHNFVANDICVHNTAFALNAIWHASGARGLPVAIFSLEMSKEQLVQRLISQNTRIPAHALRSGNVRAEDWPKLVRGVAEVSRAPIWIDDSAGVTLMEMRAKVRRLSSQLNARREGPLSLVVVDYLQLMAGQDGRAENRQQEIAEISRGLKVLARDLDVPVLAIAQLSRAVEQRHDKRPLLSDLRDSGALEQDADMVMFLYRDEYYNPDSDDKGIAEIIIGKHRNGPTGKVQLAWMEQYTKFASLARRV